MARLLPDTQKGPTDFLETLRVINRYMIVVQLLFGIFGLPPYMSLKDSLVWSLIVISPSAIYHLMSEVGKKDDQIFGALFSIVLLFGFYTLFDFGIALHNVIYQGDSDKMLFWFKIWFVPLLVNLPMGIILKQETSTLTQKETKIISISHERLLKVEEI